MDKIPFLGDRWFGDGCGGLQSGIQCRRIECAKPIIDRQNFLAQYNTLYPYSVDENLIIGYPFFHNLVNMEGYSDALDPLIIPLVKYLNKIDGIKTITSCQGSLKWSPYVHFAARDFEALEEVNEIQLNWHKSIREGWYWNNLIITYFRQEKSPGFSIPKEIDGWGGFLIQFYDMISLVKFNLEYLKISIEEQMTEPENTRLKPEAKHKFPVVAEEWKKFMKQEEII